MASVYFLSLGPGGVDNVTWGTIRTLQNCDRIYCFGTNSQSFAAETLSLLPVKSPVHVVVVPMQKDREATWKVYQDLATEIKERLSMGERIAVATEGDSGIYATTHYVKDILDNSGVKTEQFGGVPSFIAASARAGLHLVSQKERLLVVPGMISLQEIVDMVENGTTVVIMKLSMAVDVIHECMKRYPAYQYHYFSHIGRSEEFYSHDREALLQQDFPYFSLMIIKHA